MYTSQDVDQSAPPDILGFKHEGMTVKMKEWLRANMDPDLLAADEELVEVWYGIDNVPDLVEE